MKSRENMAEYFSRGQCCSIPPFYIAFPPYPHALWWSQHASYPTFFFPPPDIPNKATFQFFSAMPYLQKQMLIFHAQVQLLITASVVLKQTCALAAKLWTKFFVYDMLFLLLFQWLFLKYPLITYLHDHVCLEVPAHVWYISISALETISACLFKSTICTIFGL